MVPYMDAWNWITSQLLQFSFHCIIIITNSRMWKWVQLELSWLLRLMQQGSSKDNKILCSFRHFKRETFIKLPPRVMVLAVNPMTQRLFCCTCSQQAHSLLIHLSWWIKKIQRALHFPQVSLGVANGSYQPYLCQMVMYMDVHTLLVISRYPAAQHTSEAVTCW